MCSGVPTMYAYCERYSVSYSSGVSAAIFKKLMFKRVFFLGNFSFGLKLMLKPRTNRGSSVQKVSIMCLFSKVMARNCLLDDNCIVCVSLKRFLLARASAISSSFRRFFLSLFSLYILWYSFDGDCDCFGEFCNVFPWFTWVVTVNFVIVKLDVCTVPNRYMGRHIKFSYQSSACVL